MGRKGEPDDQRAGDDPRARPARIKAYDGGGIGNERITN